MNDEQNQPKKSFFRRFWWVFVIIGLVSVAWAILAIIGYINDQQANNENNVDNGLNQDFTPEQLAAAETALSNGIKLEDEEDDFVPMYGGNNNPNPYRLSYADYKSVTIGADETYLYVKIEVRGEFPSQKPYIGEDGIIAVGFKEDIMVKNIDGNEYMAQLGDSVNYNLSSRATLGHGLFDMRKAAEYDDEENCVKFTGNTGMIIGGSGYDYIISAFPLESIGIAYGQEVTSSCSMEAESEQFDHSSVDALMGKPGEKSPAKIKYIVGNNTYEIDE